MLIDVWIRTKLSWSYETRTKHAVPPKFSCIYWKLCSQSPAVPNLSNFSYLHSVHCLPGSELLQESARGPGRNLRPVVIAVSPSDCTPARWSKWSTITAPILLSFRHSIPNLTLAAAKSQKEQLQSHGSKMQQAGIHSCWCHWHAGYMGQETCRRTWSHEPLVST